MRFIKRLPSVEELTEQIGLTKKQSAERSQFIEQCCAIFLGKDKRKLLISGPCSADNEDAVLDYCERLARLQQDVSDALVIIPRVYTSKPRTNGMGYKGILHNPVSTDGTDNIVSGIFSARKMLLHVIQATGLYPADEMLYPELMCYTSDLLSYLAVGARSVEDQAHRLTASGMGLPVGMKNPTSGDVSIMFNAISAAQYSHHFVYHGWEVETEGNPYAHAILRGYVDTMGKMHPNYHIEDLRQIHDAYQKMNLKNTSVIVDCNHSNSGKQYFEQIRIAEEVLDSCRRTPALNRFVKGFMVESYIEDGQQKIGGGIYGKSITDPCLGWNKTDAMIRRLADMMLETEAVQC